MTTDTRIIIDTGYGFDTGRYIKPSPLNEGQSIVQLYTTGNAGFVPVFNWTIKPYSEKLENELTEKYNQ